MAQFDVYQNKDPKTKGAIPYLLDIQTDLLSSLATRVVIPLALAKEIKRPLKNLNLHFNIEKKKVIMLTTDLAGVPLSLLGEKITSLKEQREEIIAAVDFLLVGF